MHLHLTLINHVLAAYNNDQQQLQPQQPQPAYNDQQQQQVNHGKKFAFNLKPFNYFNLIY